MNQDTADSRKVDAFTHKIEEEIEETVYYLNPDLNLVRDLVSGLLTNEERYGYLACPCRLVTGSPEENSDIICPCIYRDDDLSEYNACFCGLYVSEKVQKGEAVVSSIPERRLPYSIRKESSKKDERNNKTDITQKNIAVDSLAYPVWRCKVCGYLAARNTAPSPCPICKADNRFERFL
ncbi:MAG: ferredoxin:glutaredoxin reductase [Methanospirillaceae archaeon]|nr:ferredoxin:glutaredoxin reductase [Methanospirillaceae archaeon]